MRSIRKANIVNAKDELENLRRTVDIDNMDSLSEQEKEFIKDMRKINERELTNVHAYNLLRKSEQGYANYYSIVIEIDKTMTNIFDSHEVIRQNQIDIAKGHTEQKMPDGRDKSIDSLKVEVMRGQWIIKQNIGVLRRLCSNLYNYVGTKTIDQKEVIIDEDGYNNKIESIIAKLKEIGYDLY